MEQGAEELLAGGAEGDVALLVVGDPFGATTHTDLVLRQMPGSLIYEKKISTISYGHNSSAVACIGRQCCGAGASENEPAPGCCCVTWWF